MYAYIYMYVCIYIYILNATIALTSHQNYININTTESWLKENHH